MRCGGQDQAPQTPSGRSEIRGAKSKTNFPKPHPPYVKRTGAGYGDPAGRSGGGNGRGGGSCRPARSPGAARPPSGPRHPRPAPRGRAGDGGDRRAGGRPGAGIVHRVAGWSDRGQGARLRGGPASCRVRQPGGDRPERRQAMRSGSRLSPTRSAGISTPPTSHATSPTARSFAGSRAASSPSPPGPRGSLPGRSCLAPGWSWSLSEMPCRFTPTPCRPATKPTGPTPGDCRGWHWTSGNAAGATTPGFSNPSTSAARRRGPVGTEGPRGTTMITNGNVNAGSRTSTGADQSRTKAAYGLQWNRFRILRPDEDRATFRNRTGLGEAAAGALVLDAGCGMGRYLGSRRRRGSRVVGLDLSAAVAAARDLTADLSRRVAGAGRPAPAPVRRGHVRPDLFARRPRPHPRPPRRLPGPGTAAQSGGRIAIWVYPRERPCAGADHRTSTARSRPGFRSGSWSSSAA